MINYQEIITKFALKSYKVVFKYGHTQREAAPGLYVLTHSSTKDKKKMLEKINTALKMGWKVDIVK